MEDGQSPADRDWNSAQTDIAPGVTARPIVLVGLMGVGKSSIGKRLAAALGLPFVDADDEIELAAQMTISEIFEQYGEAFFRDGERRVIARLIDGSPKVIATGGGAFVNQQTRQLILDKAVSIWIDAEIEVLCARVSRKNNRPLLQNGDPAAILRALDAERRPAYAEANIHIRSEAGPHQRTVEAALKGLQEWQ